MPHRVRRSAYALLSATVALTACTDRDGPLAVDRGEADFEVSSATTEQIDLSTWTAESYAAVSGFGSGSWNVSSDGLSVTQSVNGQPTLFYGDFEAFKTEVQGVVRMNSDPDDDFVGFALGFRPGDSSDANAEYLLVDWKRGTQSFDFGAPSCTPGGAAQAGLAVSRVFGIPTADELWVHENFDSPTCSDLDHGVEELARGNTLGSTGWAYNTDYAFRFQFTPTRLRVYVDDVLELDVAGEFDGGRLAFYNFSQANVRYSAFTVAAFNNAPGAEDDGYQTEEDVALEVGASGGVLANDADPDADALTAVLVDGPEHGSLALDADGSFLYTPSAHFHGSDAFTYVASDGDLQSDPATVTITVLPVADPPTADAGGPYEGDEGSQIAFDGTGSGDPDGDPLTHDWDFGDGASAADAGPTPVHSYADDGTYTVLLTVSDGSATDQASASVVIRNVDPEVGPLSAPGTVAVGAPVSVSADFTDAGTGDTHTARIYWGDGSEGSTATVTGSGGSGTAAGSHSYAAAGSYTITLEVTDDDGGIGSSTVGIVVETPTGTGVEDAELAAMDRAIDGYLADGRIDRPGIGKGLKSLLRNSDRALQRGNAKAAKNTLGAFQNHLDAQSGKHVEETAARDLKGRAQAKIEEIGG